MIEIAWIFIVLCVFAIIAVLKIDKIYTKKEKELEKKWKH